MQGEPFIPRKITVHLGAPDSNAENVTVNFPDYVKNVVSSEIYPTWTENAIRANIYAITSFALNRIYTEWYRSKGYNFDITSSPQYDQKFIKGRNIFENISVIADEIFNDYVVKVGSAEPYFTAFCNGTTITCDGLSQWGTVDLANQEFIPEDILKYYYGDDIKIIKNAPVMVNMPSYHGIELKLGSSGDDVLAVQIRLNRISGNYSVIPKIPDMDGVFDNATEDAVKEFQKIFFLPVTGAVESSTWYKIAYIYSSVKKLAELNSEGIALDELAVQFTDPLYPGMENEEVKIIQHYLSVIAAYYEDVPPIKITGYYDEQTEISVKMFQKIFGFEENSIIDHDIWNEMYRVYAGILESVPINEELITPYPGTVFKEGVTSEYVKILQQYLGFISQIYTSIPYVNNTGYFGPLTKNAVIAFQKEFGINPVGLVGTITWDTVATVYSDLKYGQDKRTQQFPGYTIKNQQ